MAIRAINNSQPKRGQKTVRSGAHVSPFSKLYTELHRDFRATTRLISAMLSFSFLATMRVWATLGDDGGLQGYTWPCLIRDPVVLGIKPRSVTSKVNAVTPVLSLQPNALILKERRQTRTLHELLCSMQNQG